MHDMTFEDNNIDVIFRCHSLEHARDYKKTVKEFTRVAKNDSIFLIEVPVNYETKGADLWVSNHCKISRRYSNHTLEKYCLKNL